MQYNTDADGIWTVTDKSNVWCINVSNKRSSFIWKIEWEEGPDILTVYFRKYYTDKLSYKEVSKEAFEQFVHEPSIGKYYLGFIKPNFKQINSKFMSEKKRPQTKNQASDQKRFIKISINVQNIVREWIVRGEKGDYLNLTLQMLPDGQLDKFGNLGMITQDVPKDIYDKAEAVRKGSGKEIKGPILGNGAEFDWGSKEGAPSAQFNIGDMTAPIDDLPF